MSDPLATIKRLQQAQQQENEPVQEFVEQGNTISPELQRILDRLQSDSKPAEAPQAAPSQVPSMTMDEMEQVPQGEPYRLPRQKDPEKPNPLYTPTQAGATPAAYVADQIRQGNVQPRQRDPQSPTLGQRLTEMFSGSQQAATPAGSLTPIIQREQQQPAGEKDYGVREGFEGYGTELYLRAQRSATNFNKWMLNMPNNVIRATNVIPNAIYEALDMPTVDAQYFNNLTGLDRVNDRLAKRTEVLGEQILKINKDAEKGIIAAGSEGNWPLFWRNLSGGVVDSFAPSLAMMASGGALGVGAGIGFGTALFGGAKLDEYDQITGIPEHTKVTAAIINGALEGIFERLLGSGAVGDVLTRTFTEQGKEVAEKEIRRGIAQVITDFLAKYPFMMPFSEGVEELGTELSQGLIDKYSGITPELTIKEIVAQAADAFLIGTASGASHSGLAYTARGAAGLLSDAQRAALERNQKREQRKYEGLVMLNLKTTSQQVEQLKSRIPNLERVLDEVDATPGTYLAKSEAFLSAVNTPSHSSPMMSNQEVGQVLQHILYQTQAQAIQDGKQQARQSTIRQQAQQEHKAADEFLNTIRHESGGIMKATVEVDGQYQETFILSGDPRQEGSTIVVIDPVTGENKMVPARDVEMDTLEELEPAQAAQQIHQEVDAAIQAQQTEQEQLNDLNVDLTQELAPGTVIDYEGRRGTILDKTPEGGVLFVPEGMTPDQAELISREETGYIEFVSDPIEQDAQGTQDQPQQQQPQGPATAQADLTENAPVQAGPQAEPTAATQNQAQPEPEPAPAVPIPTLKDGSPDFNAMPSDMLAHQMQAEFGQEAITLLQGQIETNMAEIGRLEKKKVKDLNERAANRREIGRYLADNDRINQAIANLQPKPQPQAEAQPQDQAPQQPQAEAKPKTSTSQKRDNMMAERERRGEKFFLETVPEKPKQYTLNVADFFRPLAPEIPVSAIDFEKSFADGGNPEAITGVRLMEVRGRNHDGQLVGSVYITKNEGSYQADVIFNTSNQEKEQPQEGELINAVPDENAPVDQHGIDKLDQALANPGPPEQDRAPKPEQKAKVLRQRRKSLTKAQEQVRTMDFYSPYDLVRQYFASEGKLHTSSLFSLFGTAGKENDQAVRVRVESERRPRFSWVSKEGSTIDEIAHILWERHQELGYDSSDFRDAIENVILEYNSNQQMALDLIKAYDESQQQYTDEQIEDMQRAEEELKQQEREAEQEIIDALFVSYEQNGLLPSQDELNQLFLPDYEQQSQPRQPAPDEQGAIQPTPGEGDKGPSGQDRPGQADNIDAPGNLERPAESIPEGKRAAVEAIRAKYDPKIKELQGQLNSLTQGRDKAIRNKAAELNSRASLFGVIDPKESQKQSRGIDFEDQQTPTPSSDLEQAMARFTQEYDSRINKLSQQIRDLEKQRNAEVKDLLAQGEMSFEGQDNTPQAPPAAPSTEQSDKTDKPKSEFGANNKIVTPERFEELKRRMKEKLGNMNMGFDPEMFAIGAEMAAYYIEAGARKFHAFAKAMVGDLGDGIRPYLRAFYNGARDLPGMEEHAKDMTPAAEVSAIDPLTTDFNQDTPKDNSNEPTRSTKAIESQTAAIEREAQSVPDWGAAAELDAKADKLIDEINRKLNQQGYSTEGINHEYPNKEVAKRIRKDVTAFSKALANTLGWEHDTIKGKPDYAHANIAPAGGDATFILWLPGTDLGVYVSIPYNPDYRTHYDNYRLAGIHGDKASILWRLTTKEDKYRGLDNRYAPADVTVGQLAEMIRKAAEGHMGRNLDAPAKPTTAAQAIENQPHQPQTPPAELKSAEAPKNQQKEKQITPADLLKLKQEFTPIKGSLKAMKMLQKVFPDLFTAKIGDGGRIGEWGEAFMPLLWDIRPIYNNNLYNDPKAFVVALSQNYIQMGDVMNDPRIDFAVFPTHGIVVPLDFEQHNLGIYNRFVDADKITNPRGILETLDFVNNLWFPNLISQDRIIKLAQTNVESDGNPTQTQPITPGGSTPDVDAGQPAGVASKPVATGNTPKTRPSAGRAGTGTLFDFENEGSTPGTSQGDQAGPVSPGRSDQPGQKAQADSRQRVQSDSGRSDGLKPEERNHVITPDDVIVPRGETAKIRANIEAIRLAKKLEKENRNATPAEKKVLAKYVGWGGIPNVFNNRYWDDNWSGKYSESYDTLKEILSPEEWNTAKQSTINAHYTDRGIISAMWDMARRLGFNGGRVLEPAGGIGHFFGLMPQDMAEAASLMGYELDKISGLIFSKLYPQAKINVTGYEKAAMPNNSMDLVISNVPFGAVKVYDSANKDISKFQIHNFFIAKSIRKLKPGGLGMFITTSATMDNDGGGKQFRMWASDPQGGNADLIEAVRLPNDAFKANAGTEVTTDILIFRKRTDSGPHPAAKPFLNTEGISQAKSEDGTKTIEIRVNEAFAAHPDRMLGTMRLAHEINAGGLYSGDSQTLAPHKGQDLEQALQQVLEKFPVDVADVSPQAVDIADTVENKEGTLHVVGGKPVIVQGGQFIPTRWNDSKVMGKYSKALVVQDYNTLKQAVKDLNNLETSDTATDQQIEAARKALNKAYDGFTRKYGQLYKNQKIRFLKDDLENSLVFMLENVKETEKAGPDGKITSTFTITKSDIFTKRASQPRSEPTTADNLRDAMTIALAYRNKVDLGYISQLTGQDTEAVKKGIVEQGLGFVNPVTGMLEDANSYLSGDVRTKLDMAREAAQLDDTYQVNVKALESILPDDVPYFQINLQLGAPWIPAEVVQEFIKKTIDVDVTLRYNTALNKWTHTINHGTYSSKNTTEFAGGGVEAINLILDALNTVSTEVKDPYWEDGKRKYKKNPEKTAEAQQAQTNLKMLFKDFATQLSESTRDKLQDIYNRKFNSWVNRKPNQVPFTHFPGASSEITLRAHQKSAAVRALTDPLLLAHQVGTGKTFTLITAAMEMRRLGTAKKPMIVVQKATVGQFAASFRQLYPSANILVPTEKDMSAQERQNFFAKIALNEFDAIIIHHDALGRIPDDPSRQIAYINERIEELREILDAEDDATAKNLLEKEIEKQEAAIEKIHNKSSVKDEAKAELGAKGRLEKQADRATDDLLNFEQLGVDALLIDEAHVYKRLGFATKAARVKGIDTSSSKRALSTMLKVRHILEKNNNKNVVFATGTPISNTMAEIWTMMKYLIPDRLKEYGVSHFDEFKTSFGEVVPSIEFTTSGEFRNVDRFSNYINLPELKTLFRSAADIVLTENIEDLKAGVGTPLLAGGKFNQVELEQTPALERKMKQYKATIKAWEALEGKEKRELRHIPLVIFGLAKRAAIDVRLVDPNLHDDPGSKTYAVADNVFDLHQQSGSYKGTQLVFADAYQSKGGGFNLYREIKRLLIEKGIPENQIEIINDHDTDAKREKLFSRVNAGEVRVLMGHTERLGIGVNVQKLLYAVHHVDAPNRPMDFEQRNGRILRQGNLHLGMEKGVHVVMYGVKKTLDATAYQRLAQKHRFIQQALSDDMSQRTLEDNADDVQGMSFDQMMANLSGSQYAVIHTKKSYDLKNIQVQESLFKAQQIEALKKLNYNKSRIPVLEGFNQSRQKALGIFKQAKFEEGIKKLKIGSKEHLHEDGKLGEVMQKLMDDTFQQLISTGSFNSPKKITMTINDHMQVGLSFEVNKGIDNITQTVKYQLINDGISEEDSAMGSSLSGSFTGAGLLISIRSILRAERVESIMNSTLELIEQHKKDNAAYEELMGKKFPRQGELETLQKEVEELEAKMVEETKSSKKTDDDDIEVDLDGFSDLENDNAKDDSDGDDDGPGGGVSEPQAIYNDMVEEQPQQIAIDFGDNNHVSTMEIAKTSKKNGYTPGAPADAVTFSERVLTHQEGMTFMGAPLTGNARIRTSADVAWLFRNLESAATENAFAVLIDKNGDYRVLYMTTGGTHSTIAETKLVLAAAREFNATSVTFVHNHPSGRLGASSNDVLTHSRLHDALRAMGITLNDSVIINLDSGKYATFSIFEEQQMQTPKQGETFPVKVYEFDRQKLHVPSSEKTQLKTTQDAAIFLSKQKRGTTGKLGVIILDRANRINRFLLLDETTTHEQLLSVVLGEVGKYGESVIITSNKPLNERKIKYKKIQAALKQIDSDLLDVIIYSQNEQLPGKPPVYTSFSEDNKIKEPGATINKNRVNDPGAEGPTPSPDWIKRIDALRSELEGRSEKGRQAERRLLVEDFIRQNREQLVKLNPKRIPALLNKINRAARTDNSLSVAIAHLEKAVKDSMDQRAKALARKFRKALPNIKTKHKVGGVVKAKTFLQEGVDFRDAVVMIMDMTAEEVQEAQDFLHDMVEGNQDLIDADSSIQEIANRMGSTQQMLNALWVFGDLQSKSLHDVEFAINVWNHHLETLKADFKDWMTHERTRRKELQNAIRTEAAGGKDLLWKTIMQDTASHQERTEPDSWMTKYQNMSGTIASLTHAIWKGYHGGERSRGFFNSTLYKLYKDVDRGASQKAQMQYEMKKRIENWIVQVFKTKGAFEKAIREEMTIHLRIPLRDENGELVLDSEGNARFTDRAIKINMETALDMWMQWQSESGRRYMNRIEIGAVDHKMTDATFQEIDQALSRQLKDMGIILQNSFFGAQEYYQQVNDVYYRRTGRRLPQLPGYIPTAALSSKNEIPYDVNNMGIFRSFTMERRYGAYDINRNGIFHKAIKYADQVSSFVHLAEPVSDFAYTLNSKKVKAALIAMGTQSKAARIIDLLNKGYNEQRTDGAEMYSRLLRLFVGTKILMNYNLVPKQLTSFAAMLDSDFGNPVQVLTEFVRYSTGTDNKGVQKIVKDIFHNHPDLKYRNITDIESLTKLSRSRFHVHMFGDSKEDVAKGMLVTLLWNPTAVGDRVAIQWGGIPIMAATYKNSLKWALDKSGGAMNSSQARSYAARQAYDMLGEFINTTQQSGKITHKSAVQYGGWRAATTFMNSLMGYSRKVARITRDIGRDYKGELAGLLKQGEDPGVARMKALAALSPAKIASLLIYTSVLPVLFATVSSLGTNFSRMWDDDEEERSKARRKMLFESTLGWTKGLFGIGFLLEYLVNQSMGVSFGKRDDNIIPVLDDVLELGDAVINAYKLASKWNDENIKFRAAYEQKLYKALREVGISASGVTMGAPVTFLHRLVDVSTEQEYDNALRIAARLYGVPKADLRYLLDQDPMQAIDPLVQENRTLQSYLLSAQVQRELEGRTFQVNREAKRYLAYERYNMQDMTTRYDVNVLLSSENNEKKAQLLLSRKAMYPQVKDYLNNYLAKYMESYDPHEVKIDGEKIEVSPTALVSQSLAGKVYELLAKQIEDSNLSRDEKAIQLRQLSNMADLNDSQFEDITKRIRKYQP